MRVWRICKQKHQQSAFSSTGGLYTPSRWTPQGFLVVYTSESLALASLEVFVHTESDRIPLVAIRAFLPDDIAIAEVDIAKLPADWQRETAYPSLQNIGKQWLLAQQTPVLKVPSAIIPVEFNYLLNPDTSQPAARARAADDVQIRRADSVGAAFLQELIVFSIQLQRSIDDFWRCF